MNPFAAILLGVAVGLGAVIVEQARECEADRDALAQTRIESRLNIGAIKTLQERFGQ